MARSVWSLIQVALLTMFLVTPSAAQSTDPVLVDEGEKLAKLHCARCHVIGKYNRMGGIGSTPSLPLLRGRDDWEDRFSTFYARNPHPSFVKVEGIEAQTNLPPNASPVDLSWHEVEALMAYVTAMPPKKLNR